MTAPTVTAPGMEPGQHVVVRQVHLGGLPATVEKAAGGSVQVALAVKDERLGRLIGADIAVEVASGRGIYRHTGKLTTNDNGVLTIALSGVERIQRREFVRVPAHVTVNVRGVDEALGGETVTLDISGRGVLISDPWNLPLGLDVRVELQLPDGGPVRALGRVVRAAAEDQKGIRFDDLARPDEDRMIRFIRERELQMLRAARNG